MTCPLCKVKLDKAILSGVEVDFCPRCYGLWFDEDELQWAKDEKDQNLRWLDIDLWQDAKKFRISPGQKLCPADRLPLYEVKYGDSEIRVDLCNVCHGIWLDRGEFKGIISYLREKADKEVLERYMKNAREELWEVFSGPELLKEEILDLLTVIKLFRYKLTSKHPEILSLIAGLPR